MEMMCWGGDDAAMMLDVVLGWCRGVVCQIAKEVIPIPDCEMLSSSPGPGCCRCSRLICKGQTEGWVQDGVQDLHDGAATTWRA